MASQLLVVHERISTWAGHLRPRLTGGPVRLVESRSAADLESALAGAPCPLVVIDLGRRPRAALDDLDRALLVAPDALVLVLDPVPLDGVAALARELGATLVIEGPATPPEVAGILARWLPLARRRSESAGWAASAPRPGGWEPDDWIAPLLANARPGGSWPPRE